VNVLPREAASAAAERVLMRRSERVGVATLAAKILEAFAWSLRVRGMLREYPSRAGLRAELAAFVEAVEGGKPRPRLHDRTQAHLAGRAAKLGVDLDFGRTWPQGRQALPEGERTLRKQRFSSGNRVTTRLRRFRARLLGLRRWNVYRTKRRGITSPRTIRLAPKTGCSPTRMRRVSS
jgi:hypothetical protein